jgi:hypothetical protein
MTAREDLTRLAAPDDASTRRVAVQDFLRTGEYDLKFPAWSGNVIERESRATTAEYTSKVRVSNERVDPNEVNDILAVACVARNV